VNAPYAKIQRWLAARSQRRLQALCGPQGVVSFSFDDAPQTACRRGRGILEQHGCHGTWYVAGGLTDQLEEGRLCHSVADLKGLLLAGHHLGCHTFSHRLCNEMSSAEMAAELARNSLFLDELGVAADDRHFSFPLGAYDLASKRYAADHFAASRITGGGLQVGQVDLNGLQSERLYQGVISAAQVAALVQETAARKGWLIFYAHDVEENPSQWGCTPALLEAAVRASLDAGCKVLSVNQALRYWQAQAEV
jgi:peptidoglycan/xylan/chitin deacetylase (PgdA/CDA1 family)